MLFRNGSVCIITCNCGCLKTICFRSNEDSVGVSFLESMFYSKQRESFIDRFERKDCLFGIETSRDELIELRDFLLNCKCKDDESLKPARLVVSEDVEVGVVNTEDLYWISLEGKEHFRSYELIYNDEDRKRLIRAIEKVLGIL